MPRQHAKRHKPQKKKQADGSHKVFSRRMILLALVFTLICTAYGIRLLVLQAGGFPDFSIYEGKGSLSGETTTRKVTLQAMRGEIYDRNGEPLVTNQYSYDLCLDYKSFTRSGGNNVRNETLLSILRLLRTPGNGERPKDYFPFDGTYPQLLYLPSVADPASSEAYQRSRVLSYLSLDEDTTASALVAYYVKTYDLDARIDGIPCYTNEEITELIRLYYDMDRTKFSSVQPYTVAGGVSTELITAQKEAGREGVRFTIHAERVYRYPGYASHILGRVSQIFAESWDYYSALGYPMNAIVGVSGCENAFEDVLHGTDGEMVLTVDSHGNILKQEITKEPVAGQDIRVTLDIFAQIAAEDALRAAGGQGAVVSMDTETGGVLVLASAPTYLQENFSRDYDALFVDPALPLVNRALSSAYLPGSTLQLGTAVAALEEGVLTYQTILPDSGKLLAGSRVLTCPQYAATGHAHTDPDLSIALRDGCPVFFGQVGDKLGSAALTRWFSALGIGQETGIELSESCPGLSVGGSSAVVASAAGAPENGCTPIQLCSMLSATLNGGTRYRAFLLKEARSFTSGDVTRKTLPEVLTEVSISDTTQDFITRILRLIPDYHLSSATVRNRLRREGITVGWTSSVAGDGAGHPENSVLLTYATCDVGTGVTDLPGTVATVVVLENNAQGATDTFPVAAGVFEAIWQK